MEDHHVDRPEVEAEQSAQPTGTNRSNPTASRVPAASENRPRAAATPRRGRHFPRTIPAPARIWQQSLGQSREPAALWLASLVVTARGQTPDPIPNSAVKTLSADGTAAQARGRAGRRQARPAPQPHPPPRLPQRMPATPVPAYQSLHQPRRGVEQPGSSSGS